MPRRFAWASLPDEELLKLRLKDLKVGIEGTWLEDCLRDLHRELKRRQLPVRPHAWLSDEWFSPDNTPGIAIPFFLAHPRLMRLERKKILEVEGGTIRECMRILRHEAGHVLQHSFQLQRRRRWQQLFGPSSSPYPKHYRPNPHSRRFVQHLRLWYAQSHPDEDFAETFAVWLTPRSAWRKRYAGWPALKKLQYVDALMEEIAEKKPLLVRRREVDPLKRLNRTLAQHYKKKQALYVVDSWKSYDKDLRRIFSVEPGRHPAQQAASFIRKHRAQIRRRVAKATGEYQLTVDTNLDEMIKRCRIMKLWAAGPKRKLLRDFTVLLTAKTVTSLYSPSRRSFAL
ncbi:MAG TPA: putative zinc-binding metallopeptidase [Xanthobacteraceae bacterium]|nr:putative zinc-binding metallopeptidase [Xanthobacteraceae bacterium]